MRYCFGVDLGGTTVKMGFLTEEGALLEKWEIKTRTEDNGKYIIPDIAEEVKRIMREKGLSANDVAGVGLGVPGPVDQEGYIPVCVNIGWRDLYPARELGSLLPGIRVEVGNDANVAALGEFWQGGGKGYKNLAFFTLGTGVGGGIILDGRVIAGSHGMGGEVGHMTVNPGAKDSCNCGNHGCLEQYASATGIVREAKKVLASGENSLMAEIENLTCKDVFDMAKKGDEAACQVVDRCMRYLAMAFSYVSLSVDPEVFLVGGGVSKAGDILLEALRKHYKSMIHLTDRIADIRLATLENDAGIYGAAKLVLD